MKIIKKGKIPKTTERFTCPNCGCVFECEVSECNVNFSQKNGNKLDNDISNLERTSHADNVKHAFQTGLMKKQLGENHHSHKLTRNDVDYIRSVYSKRDPHYGVVALAKKFGVDRTTIFDVVNRKTWRYE